MILVQFNNSGDVISCLESLKEQTFTKFEIIIVDNASNQAEIDSIIKYLESQASVLVANFLPQKVNSGYSGGNNIGIKYALEHDADYILILNPDTTLEKTVLAEMVGVARSNSKIGIVGPVIDEGDRKIVGGKISWLKPELKHIEISSISNLRIASMPLLQNNYFLTGACLLIKREVFKKIGQPTGGFDERYFLYFEDADLCLRTRKAGYELAVAKNAILHHKVSATTSKLGSARLLRYHYRNAHLFNMKNAPLLTFVLLSFWSVGVIIKQLFKLTIGREKQISKEILLGVVDFYLGRFGKI